MQKWSNYSHVRCLSEEDKITINPFDVLKMTAYSWERLLHAQLSSGSQNNSRTESAGKPLIFSYASIDRFCDVLKILNTDTTE